MDFILPYLAKNFDASYLFILWEIGNTVTFIKNVNFAKSVWDKIRE